MHLTSELLLSLLWRHRTLARTLVTSRLDCCAINRSIGSLHLFRQFALDLTSSQGPLKPGIVHLLPIFYLAAQSNFWAIPSVYAIPVGLSVTGASVRNAMI
jgi:hypothetical protein